MTKHCVSWSDVEGAATPASGSKQTIDGATIQLVRIVIPAGTRASPHSHPHEQFVQVLSGSGTLETSQGSVSFKAGDVFHFPADVEHAAEFTTETVLIESNLPRRTGSED